MTKYNITKKLMGSKTFLAAAGSIAMLAPASATVLVGVDDSSASWNGFTNVFDLGGGFTFGSGWGVDSTATGNGNDIGAFDDVAETVTVKAPTIDVADDFWFVGGDTSMGNRVLEHNLFQAFGNGSPELAALQADGTLNFSGTVLSNSFTTGYVSDIFIKEFAPDFSSVVETAVETLPGAFSVSHTLTGLGGEVQYGFRTVGVVAFLGTEAPLGNAVISTAVPEPSSALFLGLSVIGLVARRR